MASDPSLPPAGREDAGRKLCRIYAAYGRYEDLFSMIRDKSLPQKVRESASDLVSRACLNAIRIFGRYRCYHELNDIARNAYLSLPVREAAGLMVVKLLVRKKDSEPLAKIAKDRRRLLDVVLAHDDTDHLTRLVFMAENERFPEKVRVAAGLDAVRAFTAKGMMTYLWRVSHGEHAPGIVRKAALRSLDDARVNAVVFHTLRGEWEELAELSGCRTKTRAKERGKRAKGDEIKS